MVDKGKVLVVDVGNFRRIRGLAEKGFTHGICDAYYHPKVVAYIASAWATQLPMSTTRTNS